MDVFDGQIVKIENGKMLILANAPPEELARYRLYKHVLVE